MLTSKQEKFCQNIVAGMSNKDAYKNAYNTKCNDQTASNEAYKLLLKDEIQQRIDTIKKPLLKAEQITILNERTKQIEFIKQRIEYCKQKEDENAIIRYTDMLNKIYALYKEDTNDQKQENNMQKLDTQTLIKLTTA